MSTVKNEADAGMFAGVRRWFRRDTQEQTAAAGMPEEQAREIANRYYEEMGFSRPDFLFRNAGEEGRGAYLQI